MGLVGRARSGARRIERSIRTRRDRGAPQLHDPGEFYSPIVRASAVLAPGEVERIWPAAPPDPPGIDLRAGAQLELLAALAQHRFDHRADRGGLPPYDPGNEQFPPHDAAVLYALVRHLEPRRVVEIGSGWSTTVIAAAVHDGALPTEVTCVEPHPRAMLRTMAEGGTLDLRVERVETTPWSVFDKLDAGDICFIDSSHVAKTGSDVVHEFLQILPRLADGVVVHVHDVFLPEDYPKGWIRAGFNWNEQYVFQAYLVGNQRAHALAFNHWLALRHPDETRRALGVEELNGSSAWFTVGSAP